MSAPEGADVAIPQEEAIERVLSMPVDDGREDAPTLRESDRTLHSLVYTGGSTEYAHIYLAYVSGEYNGNRMLWIRYVWLSKPGAYESDMWGDNGISIRLVDGMEDPLTQAHLAALNQLKTDTEPDEVRYTEVED